MTQTVRKRILFARPTQTHIGMTGGDVVGLSGMGYPCVSCDYAARDGITTGFGRLMVVFKNAFKMLKTAYKFKPDLVYINSRFEVLGSTRDFITILIFRIFYGSRVKFSIKSHGSDIEILGNPGFFMGRIVLPFLRRNVAAWLYNSTEEKQMLAGYNYFDNNKIYVVRDVVPNIPLFKTDPLFKQKHGIPETHRTILWAGRMLTRKGEYEVVNAFLAIRKKYPVKLFMVGGGSELDNIKKIVADNNANEDVIFTGFIPEEEVITFYSNIDILAFPTYFPEGFPMVLFNSVCSGMAVVTTAVRAGKDWLKEPDNCIFAETQNSASVAAGLERILSNEQLYLAMRKNNKVLGLQFTPPMVAIELAAIIDPL